FLRHALRARRGEAVSDDSRTRALWVLAAGVAVLALAAGGLLWLRIARRGEAKLADTPEGQVVESSPLRETATAIGVDEGDCALDTARSTDLRLTALPHGKSPIITPRA